MDESKVSEVICTALRSRNVVIERCRELNLDALVTLAGRREAMAADCAQAALLSHKDRAP